MSGSKASPSPGTRCAGGVDGREPYPSDLLDEAWEPIRPVITDWEAKHPSVSGHEGNYDMREIANGILYQVRTG
ncbi:transposase [Streptomyces klenkii]|uniref:Transposase n=1 Tax=Streptomyces klenkii TaxID=1420899 RepID=A0A3B0BHJ4_9ACTN|nr:transposase [Streptomyces klenkii]